MKSTMLSDILKNKDFEITNDVEISDICIDSRDVKNKSIFIAKNLKFVEDAIKSGVAAIATNDYRLKDLYKIPIVFGDLNKITYSLLNSLYPYSKDNIKSIAVTGTNGKTTIVKILEQLLPKCSSIGTLGFSLNGLNRKTSLTTPNEIDIRKFFYESISKDIEHIAIEASSHGLDQNRLRYVNTDIGVFTNLSQDHLDYHYNMDNYCNAKSKLFNNNLKYAVVNNDDKYTKDILKNYNGKVFRYGLSGDISFIHKNSSVEGELITLNYLDKKEDILIPFIGIHNIYNILAAVASSIVLGFDFYDIIAKVIKLKKPKGRLEKVLKEGVSCFIDYAHTPDALNKVIVSLKKICKGKLITIFGCGGNRDKSKRAKMGEVASKSDLLIITSDNPRFENPKDIVDGILLGVNNNNFLIELDRKKAIKKALEKANYEDIILIAGKGHEDTQEICGKFYECNDKNILLS